MCLDYSDTSGKDGIIQFIEQSLGFPDGHISGDATRLKIWTGVINLSFDRVMHTLFSADGKWQFDDSNHTKNPFIFTDLTINQRNYNFTVDEQSNVILDIHEVYARSSTTAPYYLLNPIDAQSDDTTGFNDGITRFGWPTAYDKTGNLIKLDLTPSATVTNGLQIFINREGSYFATDSTTKTPGYAGLYHELLILEACYRYARANNLAQKVDPKNDIRELKEELIEYQSRRSRDERTVMFGEFQNYE